MSSEGFSWYFVNNIIIIIIIIIKLDKMYTIE